MINRRQFIERAGALVGGAVVSLGLESSVMAQTQPTAVSDFRGRFDDTADRVWLGPEYWANPMEDWRVANGRIECVSNGGNRNVHLLTRQLGPKRGRFELSVRAGLIEHGVPTSIGFRIGIRDSINDYRGNCILGKGVDAGIDDGALRLGDVSQRLDKPLPMDALHIHLHGEPAADGRYTLKHTVKDASDHLLGAVAADGVGRTTSSATSRWSTISLRGRKRDHASGSPTGRSAVTRSSRTPTAASARSSGPCTPSAIRAARPVT